MSGPRPTGSAGVWSTSAVAAARAFEYWRDLICDTFVQLAAAPTRPGRFDGRLVHADLDSFEMTTVHASGQRVRRTPQLIARAGEEYLLASIQTRGQGRIEQDGRVAELAPGQMALYDSTRPYTLHFDGPFEQVVVQVPLNGMLAETGLRDARGVTAVTLGVDSPAGVVAQYFRGLARLQETDPLGAATLATQGRALMASALSLAAGQTPRNDVLTRRRIEAFLHAHHADPDLTVDDVARAFLISRRTLYRLFAGAPGGVGTVLRRIRVEHAKSLLRADPGRPLDSVAVACGFAGERQFYRVFRQETGLSPGQFRGTSGQ
ncbi:AraC-like ligand-binding domain-containing protein [Amycolatopsis thermophila]|uniref:AraC-like DNA-binding protein n=1 Tax=Amycolatopsis thermophila TaxID=206084 RepID=A0ABU0F4W7_9PSEU|nr:helix-turn-helix domain-containing protein [Amycolatopsis thermophila]MDQ0382572.1 AraC-like DNA-binding protein [Amycolatopsis thermophila]